MTISSPEVPASTAGGPDCRVIVVESDPVRRAELAHDVHGRGRVETCAGVVDLAARLEPGHPVVAIFGPSLSDPRGLAQIEGVAAGRPEIGAIVVSAELSAAVFQQALRSGARDVLGVPVDAVTLRESVERVGRMLTTALPALPLPAGLPGGDGEVVAIWSTKGGSGRSVVATNLAVSLARRASRPVALVDADLAFGDVAIMLRLVATHTVMDAVAAADRADAQLLGSLMVRHEPSGLLVLPAPIEPFVAEQVTGLDITRIVDILRTFCQFVVVDTPAALNDVVVSVVEQADSVVVVAGMDIPTIKNVKLGLQTLLRLSLPEAKFRLLVNRSNAKARLDIGEIERTLGLKAQALVPSDVAVPQTVNKGHPVVLDDPGSDVARAFEALADLFLNREAAEPAPRLHSRFNLF